MLTGALAAAATWLHHVPWQTAPVHVPLAAVTGFSIGYLTHLWTDALTIEGIAPWRPWSRSRLHAIPDRARFKTGTSGEAACVVLILLGLGGLLTLADLPSVRHAIHQASVLIPRLLATLRRLVTG